MKTQSWSKNNFYSHFSIDIKQNRFPVTQRLWKPKLFRSLYTGVKAEYKMLTKLQKLNCLPGFALTGRYHLLPAQILQLVVKIMYIVTLDVQLTHADCRQPHNTIKSVKEGK